MKQSANTRRSYSKGTCRPARWGGRMVKRDVKRARRGPCMQPSLFPELGEGSVWRGRERSPGAVQGCIRSQATRLAWLPLVGTLPLYQVNREERLRLCRVTQWDASRFPGTLASEPRLPHALPQVWTFWGPVNIASLGTTCSGRNFRTRVSIFSNPPLEARDSMLKPGWFGLRTQSTDKIPVTPTVTGSEWICYVEMSMAN